MLLAVDIGNTNITLGLFAGDSLLRTLRAETRAERSADEYAASLRQMLALHAVEWRDVRAAIVASVVPRLTSVWVTALRRALDCEALVVNSSLDLGLSLALPNPEQIGADRLVNAVAAWALLGPVGVPRERGIIAVDLGTATTFDCVSPRAEFLGGAIAPGVQVGLDGLIARTAQLRRVELVAPEHVVGRTTTECLQAGVVLGYASLVDGLVHRMRRELPFACDVVATGGLASIIAPHTETPLRVVPDLTLQGLRLLHARNVPAPS